MLFISSQSLEQALRFPEAVTETLKELMERPGPQYQRLRSLPDGSGLELRLIDVKGFRHHALIYVTQEQQVTVLCRVHTGRIKDGFRDALIRGELH